MKYNVLFLDLDGTILDTLSDIASAVNYSLIHHNLKSKTIEQIRSYIGHGSKFLIKKAINDDPDINLFNSVFKVYKDYYLKNFAVDTKPYDGVYDLLKEFKEKGGKIALISNKPQDISIELLNKFFPNLFDVIYGNMDNFPTKPDPTTCFEAIKKLHIENKSEILYVGDSLVDKQTATNAGLDYVLCIYGLANPDDIKNAHHAYINSFTELRGYLF